MNEKKKQNEIERQTTEADVCLLLLFLANPHETDLKVRLRFDWIELKIDSWQNTKDHIDTINHYGQLKEVLLNPKDNRFEWKRQKQIDRNNRNEWTKIDGNLKSNGNLNHSIANNGLSQNEEKYKIIRQRK